MTFQGCVWIYGACSCMCLRQKQTRLKLVIFKPSLCAHTAQCSLWVYTGRNSGKLSANGSKCSRTFLFWYIFEGSNPCRVYAFLWFLGHGTNIFLGPGYIYIMEKVHFMGTFSKDNNKAAFLGTTSLYLICLDEFTLGLSLKICSFYNYCQ